MQDEIFPLVNNDGNIIGQATRSECHNGSKLLHPVIHIHVFNTTGELYLQKRAATKDIFPLLWDSSVGGHIDIGETPEQAALREANEELGLTDITLNYIGKYIIETEFERELTYCYYTITNKKPHPDEDEVSNGCFWSIDKIKNNLQKGLFTPNFESDFQRYLYDGINGLIV